MTDETTLYEEGFKAGYETERLEKMERHYMRFLNQLPPSLDKSFKVGKWKGFTEGRTKAYLEEPSEIQNITNEDLYKLILRVEDRITTFIYESDLRGD